MDYTNPVTATFELQRQTIKGSQRALEQGLEAQKRFTEAVVDGVENTETAQRQTVELSRQGVHNSFDALEAGVPGMAGAFQELRETVDEGYDLLLENHAELFDTVVAEYEDGREAADGFLDSYLDALDRQVDLLVEAHEELESQSVEVADRFGEQVEEMQAQVEEMQTQVREMGEQATPAEA